MHTIAQHAANVVQWLFVVVFLCVDHVVFPLTISLSHSLFIDITMSVCIWFAKAFI